MSGREREQHLVDPQWLEDRLGSETLKIIDIRGTILPPTAPQPWYTADRHKYEAGHIPGAHFVDWLQDIIDHEAPVKVTAMTAAAFAGLMSRMGVQRDDTIVIYDDDGCHIAARMWWLCRRYGHPDVRLLDGGWPRWQAEGRPSSTDIPSPPQSQYDVRPAEGWLAGLKEVRQASQDGDRQLIDCRGPALYNGETTRGQRSGHIPGAINLPWSSLVEGPHKTFKSDDALRQRLQDAGLDPHAPMTTYCNAGVSASVGLFALRLLGLTESNNYDGSWYEWESYPEHFDADAGSHAPQDTERSS